MSKFRYAVGYKGVLQKFDGPTREVVFAKVSDFLRKNNINFSPDDLLRAIDRQSNINIKTTAKKIGFNEAMTGALALIKFTTGKSTSAEEIKRRSAICAACPLANKVGGCFSCGVGAKIVKTLSTIRAKKGSAIPIPVEVKTKYCGFCSCALPMLVVTRMEDFHFENDKINLTRPDNCWQKKTSTNFSRE